MKTSKKERDAVSTSEQKNMVNHRRGTIEDKKIAIKPYLEAIAAYCEPLTTTQLKEVIFSLAKDIPTSHRVDFLDKIKTSLPAHQILNWASK